MASVETSVRTPPEPAEVRMPMGFEVMVRTVTAAEREITGMARDIKTMMEAQMRASADFARSVEEQKRLMRSMERMIEQSMQQFRSRPVSQRASADGTVTFEYEGGTRTRRPAVAGAQRTQAQAEERQLAFEDIQRAFNQAQASPMEGPRRAITGALGEFASSRQEGYTIDASGRVRTTGGRFVTADEAQRFRVNQQLRNAAVNIANQGFIRGGISSLPQGALRAAGPVAVTAGVIAGGLNFAESQRAEALAYQRALGVSNFEAQGQRVRRALFGLTMQGTMGDREADQLFNAITGMGMTGEQREEALGFAVDSYRRFGTSVDESVRLVNLATQRGVQSFDQLTGALQGVTEAARASGVSAQIARDAFISNYTAISSTVAGGGAIALSQAATQAQTQLGRSFQGANFSGMTSEQNIRVVAARLGLTVNDVMAQLSNPNTQGRILSEFANIEAETVGTLTRAGTDEQVISRLGELGYTREQILSGQVPNEVFRSIGNQLAQEGAFGAYDPFAITSILSGRLGINIDESQAFEYLARSVAGGGFAATAAGSAEQRQEEFGLSRIDREQYLTQSGNLNTATIAREIFGGDYGSMSGSTKRLVNQYLSQVNETNIRNRPLEQLLRSGAREDDLFTVQTGTGQRVVDFRTLISEFPDQIASGSAQIFRGESAGQTLGEAYGFDNAVLPAELMGVVDEAGRAELGRSIEEAIREEGEESQAGVTGRVVIQPSPRLDALLEIYADGEAVVDSRRAGVAPPTSYSPAPGG